MSLRAQIIVAQDVVFVAVAVAVAVVEHAWPNVYGCLSQEMRYDGRRNEVRPDGFLGDMMRPATSCSPVLPVVVVVVVVFVGAEDELVMICYVEGWAAYCL